MKEIYILKIIVNTKYNIIYKTKILSKFKNKNKLILLHKLLSKLTCFNLKISDLHLILFFTQECSINNYKYFILTFKYLSIVKEYILYTQLFKYT